jgi:hypothetical protein
MIKPAARIYWAWRVGHLTLDLKLPADCLSIPRRNNEWRVIPPGSWTGTTWVIPRIKHFTLRMKRFNQGLRGKGSLVQADPWKNMSWWISSKTAWIICEATRYCSGVNTDIEESGSEQGAFDHHHHLEGRKMGEYQDGARDQFRDERNSEYLTHLPNDRRIEFPELLNWRHNRPSVPRGDVYHPVTY